MRTSIAVSGRERVPVVVAETVLERVRGLIGATTGPGLLLRRTRSVHTFGMRAPIDVVLLDARDTVLDVVRLAPRRFLFPRARVRSVLEVWTSPFRAGDRIVFEETAEEDPADR